MGTLLCVLREVSFTNTSLPSPQAMAYFIHVMEPLVSRDYIMIYFHTLCQSDSLPDSNFLKQLYNMVDGK